MWRVDYGDGKEFDLPKNRKLEPLMPTSQAFTNLNNRIYSSAMPATPYRDHIRNTNLSASNHHLGSATDEQQQNKRGSSNKIEEVGMVASSRWNPTPEQLYGLEEIYRSGTRTPSANQIQQIALKLRRFGKIEGKNVFYWFQNHKARERQKRRRQQQQLNSSSLPEQPLRVNIESLQRKLSGLSRTGFEVGQTKNRVTPSNCSTISEVSLSFVQESVSMPTAVAVAKSKTDERIQSEVTEFQRKISTSCSTTAKHAMKQMMEYFCSPPTTTRAPNLDILLEPNGDINAENRPEDEREYQTLELFPISIGDRDHDQQMIELAKNDSEGLPVTNESNKFTPFQFFEFLPLKK